MSQTNTKSGIEAILSCKLYRSSRNKEKILAAMKDPLNAELVQQVASYLDDKYYTSKKSQTPEPEERSSESEEFDDDFGEAETSTENVTVKPSKSTFKVIPPSAQEEQSTESEEEAQNADENTPKAESNTSESSEDTSEESESELEVKESTKLSGETITTSKVKASFELIKNNMLAPISGLLNANEETCGVSRILVKDNELWIYYEDRINLNNVMAPAIQLLNAAAYTYLDFNRLARSDNAIVFEINKLDTNMKVDPISALDKNNGRTS